MSMSANVLEMRLRECRTPDHLISECGSAVRRVGILEAEVQMLRERIAFLEQHVAPEIAKPPVREPVYHRRSKWD